MKKLIIITKTATVEVNLPNGFSIADGNLVVGEQLFPLDQIVSWREARVSSRPEQRAADARNRYTELLARFSLSRQEAEEVSAAAHQCALAERRLARLAERRASKA